jgi:hypothetical protein
MWEVAAVSFCPKPAGPRPGFSPTFPVRIQHVLSFLQNYNFFSSASIVEITKI